MTLIHSCVATLLPLYVANTSNPSRNYHFLSVARRLAICSPSNLRVSDTDLLVLTAELCTRSPEPAPLVTRSLCSLTDFSLFPRYHPSLW